MAGALRELIELLLTEIAISGTDGKNKSCSFPLPPPCLLQQASRVSVTSPLLQTHLFFISLTFPAILLGPIISYTHAIHTIYFLASSLL
jgi:hypothetical protein